MVETNEREIMRLVDKEIRIMSALDHPHVIHLEEVFEDEDRVCFVMELAQGGEVFDRLIEKVSIQKNISLLLCISKKSCIENDFTTFCRNSPYVNMKACAPKESHIEKKSITIHNTPQVGQFSHF